MKAVTPLGNRIIVLPKEALKKQGSIIIPDASQERNVFGTVVKVGPEVDKAIKEGSEIMYGKNSGTSVTLDEVEYLLMKDTDVYMVIGE